MTLLPGAAHAAEWDSVYHPAPAPGEFAPAVESAPTAAGSWFGGSGPAGSTLARYDASGHILAHATTDTYYGGFFSVTNLPDGGVLALVQSTAEDCGPQRFDASARLVWKHAEQACSGISIDGAGGIWSLTQAPSPPRLKLFRPDGTDSLDLPLTGERRALTYSFFADPLEPAAYIAGAVDVGAIDGSGHAAVERVATQGLPSWRWTDETPGLSRAIGVMVTSDGNVFAIGDASVNEDARLIGIKLDRNGNLLRLERSQDMVSAHEEFGISGPLFLMAGTDASAYALAHRNGDPFGSQVLVRFGASGAIEWTAPLGALRCDCTAEATANGGIALGLYDPEGPAQILRRFAPNGTSQDQPLQASGSYYDWRRYLATGAVVPLDTTLPAATTRKLVASSEDSAGNTYLLSLEPGTERFERIGSGSSPIWSIPITAFYSSGSVKVGGGRACALTQSLDSFSEFERFVTCADAATGQNVSTNALPGHEYEDSAALVSLTQGSGPKVLVAQRAPRTLDLLELQPGGNGATLFHKSEFELHCQGVNAAGDTLVVGREVMQGIESATVIDAAGHVQYGPVPVDAPVCNGSGEQLRLFDDRSALLFGVVDAEGGITKMRVTRLGATGAQLWSKVLDGDWNWIWSAVGPADVYLAVGKLPGALTPTQGSARVIKLALADGHVSWDLSSVSPPPPTDFVPGLVEGRIVPTPRLWLDQGSGKLLVAAPDGKGLQFRALDSGTGLPFDVSARSCGGARCDIASVSLDALGRLHVAANLDPSDGQGALALFRRDHPFDLSDTYARIDQPALEGAWYSPASTGQGLVFDYIDSAGTVFWTWFTFTPEGGLAPGAQRWYTLQGALPDGQRTTTSLQIFRNTGGRFAGPPATSAELVGHAILWFGACDLALLYYGFIPPENDGTGNVLVLRPLTPTGTACAPAGAQPADAVAAANGFDTRQSGTWYVPGNGGQGFTFVVRPGAQGNYVFGTWFTYDPADHADDPTAQHWFTLQGGLANASNGTAALTISRTIGGTFDAAPTRDTFRVGTATLHFTGCGSATLDYQFDSSDVAAAFAGLSGHLNLAGLGTCP